MKIKNKNRLRDFFSPKTGIVNGLYLYSREQDDPDIYNIFSEYPDFQTLLRIDEDFELRPGAADTDRIDARNAAIGEVLERYSMVVPWRTKEMKLDSVTESTSLSVKDVRWFHEEQWGETEFEKPSGDDSLGFISGRDEEGERIYFPAQFINSSYSKRSDEPKIGYPYSTGMATGYDYEETILKGVLEQVERDSAIISWFKKDSLRKIELDQSPLLNRLQQVLPQRMKFYLIDTTTDLEIPSVMAVGLDRDGFIGPMFSMSAELSLEEACADALIELCQMWINFKRARFTEKYLGDTDSKTVRKNITDRIEGCTKTDLQDRLAGKEVIRNIEEKDYSIYTFDLTPPELQEKGMVTTRVVMPDLVQFGHPENMYLGNTRFYELGFNYNTCKENLPPFLH